MNLRRAVLALLLFVCAAAPASAHTRSMSFSRWTFDDSGAHVQLRISLLELTRVPPGTLDPQYFANNLQLLGPDGPFPGGEVAVLDTAPEGWAVFQWHIPHTPGQARAIQSTIFSEIIGSHSHFARIVPASTASAAAPNQTTLERILTLNEPRWELNEVGGGETHGSSPAHYFILGIKHILTGWDHLAFVAVLLLLSANLRELLFIVTGFTIAHSLTLVLAVLGVLRPHSVAVEVHIAFSIALIAGENLWLLAGRDRAISWSFVGLMAVAGIAAMVWGGALGPLVWLGLGLYVWCHFGLLDSARRPIYFRALVTFLFGLVHGMGFAGVLMDMHLPASRLVPALIGFNVGVEAGQIAAVLVFFPLLIWIQRRSLPVYRGLAMSGSAAFLALGVFWAVTRAWG